MRRLLLSAVASVVLASAGLDAVEAQTGPYRFLPGDTLRYREITDAEVQLFTPQGPVPLISTHDATIGVAVVDPGRVTAWYDRLYLRSIGPDGDLRPDTGPYLGDLFHLALNSAGRARLVSHPDFGSEVLRITDLTHQFDDFFIEIPGGRPAEGASWSDTISTDRSSRPGEDDSTVRVRRFTVRGDTIYEGTRALLIDVEQEVEVRTSGPMADQPLTVTTQLAGEEIGHVVFDFDAGRMLHRIKDGILVGTFTVTGAGAPVTMRQEYLYVSTIEYVGEPVSRPGGS